MDKAMDSFVNVSDEARRAPAYCHMESVSENIYMRNLKQQCNCFLKIQYNTY